MDKDILLSQLTPEDLKSPLDICAATIGTDNIYKLCECVGGRRVSLPKPDELFKGLRKRNIIADYKNGGYTQKTLAEKYDVSERTVINYINAANKKKQSK